MPVIEILNRREIFNFELLLVLRHWLKNTEDGRKIYMKIWKLSQNFPRSRQVYPALNLIFPSGVRECLSPKDFLSAKVWTNKIITTLHFVIRRTSIYRANPHPSADSCSTVEYPQEVSTKIQEQPMFLLPVTTRWG